MLTPRDKNQMWALLKDFGGVSTRIVPPKYIRQCYCKNFEIIYIGNVWSQDSESWALKFIVYKYYWSYLIKLNKKNKLPVWSYLK